MSLIAARNSNSSLHLPRLILAGLLTGCASSTNLEVDVSQEFPTPLVVPSPVHMGIYISPEFEQYVYQEFENVPVKQKKKKKNKPKKKEAKKETPAQAAEQQEGDEEADGGKQEIAEKGSDAESSAKQTSANEPASVDSGTNPENAEATAARSAQSTQQEQAADNSEDAGDAKNKRKQRLKMRVALGEAQARMVRRVLPPVFQQASLLDSLEPENRPGDMDLYVVPEIKRLQYTTPRSTRTKVYEIWLQYDFVIYDNNDDVVTRWNLPCYGKTPSAMMTSQADALQAATQMALRDCGAAFSTGFSALPAVERWLQAREQRQRRAAQKVEGE